MLKDSMFITPSPYTIITYLKIRNYPVIIIVPPFPNDFEVVAPQ